jgi:hypothetical protein
MMPRRLQHAVTLAAMLLPAALAAQAVTVADQVIPATADIFAAGLNTVPPFVAGGGTLPAGVSFTAQPNRVLTFSSVAGLVACWVGPVDTGPDGLAGPTCAGGTNINGYGGLSGIAASDRAFFLVGVFLGPDAPTPPAPPTLHFGPGVGEIPVDFATLAPQIAQLFFVGDGLTGTGVGAAQQFLVPSAATRLYLGFEDAAFFAGDPGYYFDNHGALTASYEISAGTIPEPTTVALVGGGLMALLGVGARRRFA